MSNKLFEGLKAKDLEHFVNNTFLVDTYKSKMGEDKDVAVISFRVKDRLPAIDLMEFIERGYGFVLDADISSGEESDGQYSVFVEIERNKYLPENIEEIIRGVGKLTNIEDWRFRYHKEWKGKEFNLQTISETVPTTPETYETFLHESKVKVVKEFLNQTMYDNIVIENNIMTLYRPWMDGMKFEIMDLGNYKDVMKYASGDVQLDEASNAQTVYLHKIFGDYEIIKLGENFMVRRDDQALLVKPF